MADLRSASYAKKVQQKTGKNVQYKDEQGRTTRSVSAGSNNRGSKDNAATGADQLKPGQNAPQLQTTRVAVEPEKAEAPKPSFSNAFKGQGNNNKQTNPSNGNDKSRSNGQADSNRGSGSLPRNVESAQGPQTRNGARPAEASIGRDSLNSGSRTSSLAGFETRVARLKAYEERVDARAQRSEDVFRAIPGLRGDNYVQTGSRYLLSIPGRTVTELPERLNIAFQKGYAAAEGTIRKESRATTTQELKRAGKETPEVVAKSNDPRDPRGAVNILLLAFGTKASARQGKVTGRAVSELRPESFSGEMPGAPRGPVGDPILNPRPSQANPSRLTVGTRSQRLPQNIREKIPFAIDKTRDPLSFSDITARGGVVERKAATPSQAAALRTQTAASARKAFRDPRFGREFRLDVLENILARQKADNVLRKKLEAGKVDATGRRLLSPQETKSFVDLVKRNRKVARKSQESLLASERRKQTGFGFNKDGLLGNNKGEFRGFGEVDSGRGLKLLLEKPRTVVLPRFVGRFAPLVVGGLAGSRFRQSQGGGLRSNLVPAQRAREVVDSPTKPKEDSAPRIAAIVGTAAIPAVRQITRQSQRQSQKSIQDLAFASDYPYFPKTIRGPEGGGLGGSSGYGKRSSRTPAYAPSLTGIELGIKQKNKKPYGFSGLEVRGI